MAPIHELIHQLESEGVIIKTHSPFNCPIWLVQKSDGAWRLIVDYRGLNEVTPPLSAAVPDMLELQYELESKEAKWYATIDIANDFFRFLWQQSADHSLLLLRGVSIIPGNDCPGVETQSHCLPWTNPDCNGKG